MSDKVQPRITSLRKHWSTFSAVLILALLGLFLVRSLPYHSLTTDETVHIPAGYANWQRHDFAPNNEHPPLAKLWATLPWLFLKPIQPPPPTNVSTPGNVTTETGTSFWQANAGQMDTLVFWARVPMLLLTLLLGTLLFWAGRRYFGPRAAILALLLFSLEPTILGHGWIVHTDIPATTAYFAWWLTLAAYARHPTWRRATLLGVVTGLAITTKYSLLILLPLGLLTAIILWLLAARRGYLRRAILGHLGIVIVMTLVILNAVYFFEHQPLSPVASTWIQQEEPQRGEAILTLMHTLTPLIPPYYQLGAYTVLTHNQDGHAATLLGQYSMQGWWYYFPLAFALKTTLPFLLLTVVGLAWALWHLLWLRRAHLLWLLLPLACYAASTMASHINIGIRHFLPVYPFCFLLAGALLDRLLAQRPRTRSGTLRFGWLAGGAVVVGLLGWHLAEAVRTYPNQLSYFNQLAQPHPHWYYLADSNIEWGQDVGALADFLHAQGESHVRAAVVNQDVLELRGINVVNLLLVDTNQQVSTRYIAIGASYLNGSVIKAFRPGAPDTFAAFRTRVPEQIIGGSIYLYRADTLPNPPPPTGPLPLATMRVTIADPQVPTTISAGGKFRLRMRITNQSAVIIPAANVNGDTRYQIRVGDRWRDPATGAVVSDDGRQWFFFPCLPGDMIDVTMIASAPKQPGDYLLDLDLVQEGVAWFGEQGGTPLRIPVRIVP